MKKLIAVLGIISAVFQSITAETLNDKNTQQDVKVFVINLERSTERRKHILDECKRHNLKPILFKAIDGYALSEKQLSEMVIDHKINGLSKGFIGCSLSHIGVYKRIVDENINLALILEDDAVLNDNISRVLTEISVFNKSTNKPFVYLLSKPIQYIENKKIKLPSTTLYSVFSACFAYGYIINYKAAKELSTCLYPVRFRPDDDWKWFRYATSIQEYCVVPEVVSSANFSSTIDKKAVAKIHMYRLKKVFFPNIKTSLKRFLDGVFVRPFLKIKQVKNEWDK
jgi:glycosyl transferase family 25